MKYNNSSMPNKCDKPMFASNSACGKAIIVGEHAVIYGAKAVAIPLPSLSTELKLVAHQRAGYHVRSGVISPNAIRLKHLKKVVFDAFKVLQIPPFPFEIKFSTNSLLGAGLGSSAALSVAMIRLLGTWFDKDLSETQIARFANYLERRFHGSPSGLDTAVVACGVPILFQKNQPLQKINVAPIAGKHLWRFALIDSGVRSSTLLMVKRAMPYFQRNRSCVVKCSHYASVVAKALAQGKVSAVADAMYCVDKLLREANVTTEHLVNIIEQVRGFGVLAAKSTGAGGGGCVLALLKPLQAEQQLSRIRKFYGASNVYEVVL